MFDFFFRFRVEENVIRDRRFVKRTDTPKKTDVEDVSTLTSTDSKEGDLKRALEDLWKLSPVMREAYENAEDELRAQLEQLEESRQVLKKAKAELKKEKEEFEKKRLASCEIAVSQGKVGGGGGSDSEALTKSSEEVAKLKETLSKCETKIHEMSDNTSTVQAELESCKKQQELQDQCCKDAADSAAQIASLAAAVSEG